MRTIRRYDTCERMPHAAELPSFRALCGDFLMGFSAAFETNARETELTTPEGFISVRPTYRAAIAALPICSNYPFISGASRLIFI